MKLIEGGAERFDSVGNGLAAVPESVPFVAVHDAVRPLVTTGLIDAVFRAAKKHGAAIPAIPVADTLKRVDPASDQIADTLSRVGLWQAQTPQVFRRDWLVEAYARRYSLQGPITDDAQLVEAIGQPVHVVQGSARNFKITTKEDLELAELLLKSQRDKPSAGSVLGFGEEAQW